MAALFRLMASLARTQIALVRGHAGARIGLLLALAVFTLLALGFALALGVRLLAERIGLTGALLVGLGVAVAGLLVVGLMLLVEGRRHARAMEAAAAERRRMVEALMLAALPGLKSGTAMAAGLALLVAVLLATPGRKDPE